MVKDGDYERVLGVRRYRVGVKRAVLFKAQGGRVPVRGWFLVNGDEGFCKSIVFRLDRATEIEKSPKTGITWSITSSDDGFAPPAPLVGLNLKMKRLMENHEFPRRKGICDGKIFTILARGSGAHRPGARSRQERALCVPRQRRALSPGRRAEVNARRRIRRPRLLPPWGGGNGGRLFL